MSEGPSRPWIYDPQDEDLLSHDGRWRQRRRIAELLRILKRLALRADLDEGALSRLERKLARQVRTFAGAPEIGDRMEYMASLGLTGPRNRLALEMSGVIGRSNAASLPMRFLKSQDGKVCAEVRPDNSHEGPPGCLHGGLIAALFDEFLGLSQDDLPGPPGLTGTLSVRYIRPTPTDQLLTLMLRSAEVEGRKRLLKGELWAGGQCTASCDALFIQPREAG
ncbi:PaaI family thioesterase [Sphingobium baderi]|uniref:PaaI family thioesterase n=1 Tax=Sphingobium baderi TaxID=1332080 RepID=UPI000AB3B189|nr:PaaI family thioesterase [Sphingobium baderi]